MLGDLLYVQFGLITTICVHSSYASRPEAAVLLLGALEVSVKA